MTVGELLDRLTVEELLDQMAYDVMLAEGDHGPDDS